MALFVLSDPPFNWCWLKLKRAREHLKTLNDEIGTWGKAKPYSLAYKSNTEMTRYGVVVNSLGSPPLEHWALIAADCFHNLRTALDQFIYAVAVYQSKADPPPDEKILQFPICDTAERFKDQRRSIRALSDPVRAVIERVQPYNRPHYAIPPLLAVLRDFDDTDKHRLLQLALMQPSRGGFENLSGLAPGQPREFFVHIDTVEDGTEVAAIILDRPTPNVRYDFLITMHVAIRHAAGPRQDRTALQGLIGDLINEVEAVIMELYKVL